VSTVDATRDALAVHVGEPPLQALVEQSGLTRVHLLAWRDLADPEAGGSEVHADKVAEAWARAGLDVTMRTAAAPGQKAYGKRNGYSVVRKAGRYSVFPRTALSGAIGRTGPRDGLVEIWNGMPFFSPVWARCPRIVFLHHVHAEMWRMVLPPKLAKVGETIEFRAAPPFYRSTQIVTLSQSSRDEIIDLLKMPPQNVTVVPPGIDAMYEPGGTRSPHPLVVAVGRLVPVKRPGELVSALLETKKSVPALEAVIVGEGYERDPLEAQIRAAGAQDWLRLPGRVSDAELVELYRKAWVLTSASAREGWGMTLTEAAACGTPAVVTDIAGHRDSADPGVSGILVPQPADLAPALVRVLTDPAERARLATGALKHASKFTWEATARDTFQVLAAEAARTSARRGR
jgi:glycosyltransferase involved in cell wall biosynthesis